MANNHPIICLISTYKEGALVQGAIRSVMGVAKTIYVTEGLTEPMGVEGEATDLGMYAPDKFGSSLADIRWYEGEWKSEAEKRTSMLRAAKRDYGYDDFWLLTLDADEILVWGEHLQDYVHVLNPGRDSPENIPSFKCTEAVWVEPDTDPKKEHTVGAYWTDYKPSHLCHASLIVKYTVGCWQFENPQGLTGFLDSRPALPPLMGEPHIHHRPYLRRFDRATLRLNEGEELRWLQERGLKKS